MKATMIDPRINYKLVSCKDCTTDQPNECKGNVIYV